MTNIKQKLRARREYRKYERALNTATPAMRAELIAIASRQSYYLR